MHRTRRDAIRRTQQWRVLLVGGAAAISAAVATGLGLAAVATTGHGVAPATSGAPTQSGDPGIARQQPGDASPLVSGGGGQHHAKSSGS